MTFSWFLIDFIINFIIDFIIDFALKIEYSRFDSTRQKFVKNSIFESNSECEFETRLDGQSKFDITIVYCIVDIQRVTLLRSILCVFIFLITSLFSVIRTTFNKFYTCRIQRSSKMFFVIKFVNKIRQINYMSKLWLDWPRRVEYSTRVLASRILMLDSRLESNPPSLMRLGGVNDEVNRRPWRAIGGAMADSMTDSMADFMRYLYALLHNPSISRGSWQIWLFWSHWGHRGRPYGLNGFKAVKTAIFASCLCLCLGYAITHKGNA